MFSLSYFNECESENELNNLAKVWKCKVCYTHCISWKVGLLDSLHDEWKNENGNELRHIFQGKRGAMLEGR